jgi:hypothetical protein
MRTAEQRKIENKNENLFVLLHPAHAHIVVNPWIKESAPASVPQKGLSPCRITTSDPNTYLSLTQNDYRLRRDLRKYGDLLPKKGTFKDEERASRLLVTPKGSPLPEALIAFGSLTFSVWGEIHGFASQPRDWFAIVGAIYSFKEPPFFFTEESSSFNQVDKCLSIINNKTVILTDAPNRTAYLRE